MKSKTRAFDVDALWALDRIGEPSLSPDGAQAVALYQEHQPDLVLLDVNMPILDGVQALAQIQQLDPNAVVVMLTSLANRHTVEECLRLGAVDYIRKDTQREELTAKFTSIIADCYGGPEEATA